MYLIPLAWTWENGSTASGRSARNQGANFKLAHINHNCLHIINFATLTLTSCPLSITDCSSGNQYMWVGEDLFCSGGRHYKGSDEAKAAYLLRREEQWAVIKLPPMIDARGYHGLWYYQAQDSIYVFGGKHCYSHSSKPYTDRSGSPMTKCEKLCLRRNAWHALPDMKRPRSCFNPCEYRSYVYLCGNGSDVIEAMDPRNDTFLRLQIRLAENSSCLLLLDNQQLVILSSQNITRMSGKTEYELEKVSETSEKSENDHRIYMAPVIDTINGVCYYESNGFFYKREVNTL